MPIAYIYIYAFVRSIALEQGYRSEAKATECKGLSTEESAHGIYQELFNKRDSWKKTNLNFVSEIQQSYWFFLFNLIGSLFLSFLFLLTIFATITSQPPCAIEHPMFLLVCCLQFYWPVITMTFSNSRRRAMSMTF